MLGIRGHQRCACSLALDVWGYGQSLTCTLNHVQQHSTGGITQRFSNHYRHTADPTGGNSGSGLIYNNQIVGVVTHCPCPNVANRIEAMTRQLDIAILASQDVLDAVRRENHPEVLEGFLDFGERRLRGHEGLIRLWGRAVER
jgi:hypothetical protein